MAKPPPKPEPKTAREFALRAAQFGLECLENYSQNPHDYSKVAAGANESFRLLFEIEQAELVG